MALLHIQPPAFNLFVGVVERWSPLSAVFTYQVLYLACGLTLLLVLRALLLELGCTELAATVGTVVVALDPVLLSYENTVTYELPVATLWWSRAGAAPATPGPVPPRTWSGSLPRSPPPR